MGICDDFQQRRLQLELRQLFGGCEKQDSPWKQVQTVPAEMPQACGGGCQAEAPHRVPQTPPKKSMADRLQGAKNNRDQKQSPYRAPQPRVQKSRPRSAPHGACQVKSKRQSLSAEEATAAAASLVGGLHPSDIQEAILVALPEALQSLMAGGKPPITVVPTPSMPRKPLQPRRPAPRWQVAESTNAPKSCQPSAGGAVAHFGSQQESSLPGESTPWSESCTEGAVMVPRVHNTWDTSCSEKSVNGSGEAQSMAEQEKRTELQALLQLAHNSLADAARERESLRKELHEVHKHQEEMEQRLAASEREREGLLRQLQEAQRCEGELHATRQQCQREKAAAESLRQLAADYEKRWRLAEEELAATQHQDPALASALRAPQTPQRLYARGDDDEDGAPEICFAPLRQAVSKQPGFASGDGEGDDCTANLSFSFDAVSKEEREETPIPRQAPSPEQRCEESQGVQRCRPGESLLLSSPELSISASRGSSQQQLEQICDEFRLQVRDLVTQKLPSSEPAAAQGHGGSIPPTLIQASQEPSRCISDDCAFESAVEGMVDALIATSDEAEADQ
eukprot:TRINITY_DN8244_c0_g1_i1.p1 TRINITY_DN8244_c0_g1~~TRINITY_DN8244_c0_g1_i1.p1  ORF type:complete len:655 (-),score=164.87 TRINITY_DN8244_c0_g1_i1:24-1721(-)